MSMVTDTNQSPASNTSLLFSVLVPTYNQANYLPMALDSLLAQSYPNWEALVVNDGSTDDTQRVAEGYAIRDSRIRVFHKNNGGVGSALNEGLRQASGEWICWLSSDDLFEPEKLAIHHQAINEKPRSLFFFTDFSLYYEAQNQKCVSSLEYRSLIPPKDWQVIQFFKVNYVNGISIAVHRSIFKTIGFFSPYLRYGQDFDLWLRIASKFPLDFIDKLTSITRIHCNQTTNTLPVAGGYESAIACLIFLNGNSFSRLFPRTDLLDREAILKAASQVISVVTKPDSYINSCGFGPALIDRFREFVLQIKLPAIVAEINFLVSEIAREASVPQEVKEAVLSWLDSYNIPFVYQRYDPINEMTNHARRCVIHGNPEEASGISEYLEKHHKNIRALMIEQKSEA